MIRTKICVFIFCSFLICLNACQTNNIEIFNRIHSELERDNYFKAEEIYRNEGDKMQKSLQLYTEAVLDNAYNKTELSMDRIHSLISEKNDLPDSLMLKLFEIKLDNAVKLFRYAEAKNTVRFLLSHYREHLNELEIADYENSYNIWAAVEHYPPMETSIGKNTVIRMHKDLAGLNTLNVTAGVDTVPFIFDTGANLSATSLSVAVQLGMELIDCGIEVGTITGSKVMARLGICSHLRMGNISFKNVLFLVLPDDALFFQQIEYQINGILGFPVIQALGEIQVKGDSLFIVPAEETVFDGSPNMAMNGLTPLICIDNRHYTFDTGADHTMFYQVFYQENQVVINQNYEPQKIRFGGAGGHMEVDGYKIDWTMNIEGKEVLLSGVHVLTEKIREDETCYGNIGQDLIRQFDTMIINFNNMFIAFK